MWSFQLDLYFPLVLKMLPPPCPSSYEQTNNENLGIICDQRLSFERRVTCSGLFLAAKPEICCHTFIFSHLDYYDSLQTSLNHLASNCL